MDFEIGSMEIEGGMWAAFCIANQNASHPEAVKQEII